MMLRTPHPKRHKGESTTLHDSPAGGGVATPSDQGLVIYEDLLSPAPAQAQSSYEPSDQHLCTYQCRQMVKADVLEALSNAEKQVKDDQVKLEQLNENFCKSEVEMKKFRDKFYSTEQELAAARGRELALQEQLLKEVNDSQERFKKQLKANSELEVKLQSEMNIRRKAETAAASAEEKANTLEGKLKLLSESIERERQSLRNELAQNMSQSKLSVSRITADLERMTCRTHNAENKSELLTKQLEDIREQLNECVRQKSEVEKKLSSFMHQDFPSNDSTVMIKHLQEELRNYESEVLEARKLKLSRENIELLKEKLLEEKRGRERAESELLKFPELHLTINKLEDELSSWKSLLSDIPGVSSIDDIVAKFAAIQKEVLEETMKIGEVNARLKQAEAALDAAELGKQTAETETALLNVKAEALKSDVKRIEAMLSMATEEREKLKAALNESKMSNSDEVGCVAGTYTHVQELEASLGKKESYVKDLERELSEQREVSYRQHDEIKLLNERLIDEARRIKSLERESDRLRSEVALLESKLGHGDFSTASTKVLRMVNTLAVDNEAKQTIEALRTELQKTKDKLQAIEELKTQSGDAGKPVDYLISDKIVQLNEEIATLKKREERYKTVFADRISVFRRACCELFGYKIVMDEHQRPNGIPVTLFTLQSIYAQNDEEKLDFEYESGNTSILANGYTSQSEISRQVEVFVRKYNSIPAFTANLTMESFNRRTIS